MKSIADVFDPARNSLNALRLIFAATVIVSHSWLVSGLGLPPMLSGTDPGLVAVAGFFAISGYLVTSSRLRSWSLLSYLWRRFLRIYPAFLVALVVVAFVLAPLSTVIYPASQVDLGSAGSYVLSNAGLYIRQVAIDGTLTNNAFPFVWNIPLWTLFYEALCYVVVGVLVSVVPRRMLGSALGALLVASTATSLLFHLWPGQVVLPIVDNAASLASFFAAGALLYIYRSVPASGALAGVAVALAILLATLGVFKPLAAVPVAYAVLYAGSRLPLHRIGRSNDISYGMYIYGFPVQQLTMLLLGGAAVLPLWLFAIISIVATVPLAWLSWLGVEKPALRLRRLRSGTNKTRVTPQRGK